MRGKIYVKYPCHLRLLELPKETIIYLEARAKGS